MTEIVTTDSAGEADGRRADVISRHRLLDASGMVAFLKAIFVQEQGSSTPPQHKERHS